MKQLFIACVLSFFISGCQSSTSKDKSLSAESPLKKETLEKHTVVSDGHQMAVWQKK